MKQHQSIMSQWVKSFVASASMLIFSVSLASGDITTAPNTTTPYAYTDPSSSAPSYNNVGRPIDEEANSLALNNQLLGLSGPIQISGTVSSNYGSGVQAAFSHLLGFDDAISLLGAYASEENRIDITWAHAWTDKQRTKLSVERLEEKMDFDYDSGSTSAWVPQYSYGAGYQYLFNKNWLKSAELSGYYANAQSQDLDTVRFTGTDGNLYDNYRHIAGATSKGSEATVNVSPWKTGLLGLGLNYDSVNYNTKYEDTDAENSSGLGFTLSLEQLLSKHVKLDLEGSQREVYDDYTAGISFLTPSNLEVGVSGERTIGENGSASDSRFNLNLAYFLDDKNRYTNGYNLENVSESDLAQWASQSVAYMDEVLAAADQKTVLVQAPQAVRDANQSLNASDETPVLSLTVGEINHISIADYVEKLNLTDAQKQSTPTIKGGPAGIAFNYDNQAESLVTTTEVPESATTAVVTPLVIVFPQDENVSNNSSRLLSKAALSDALDSDSELTFRVTVGTSTAPTLNSNFSKNQSPVLGKSQTWTFLYEDTSNPKGPTSTDSNIMFLNSGSQALTEYSITGNSSIGTHNCYKATYSNTTETLTVTTTGSSTCPDTGTISFKTSNGLVSPTQSIVFTQQPASTPFISGGAITSPSMTGGSAYSPGHTFTSDEVSPGSSQTFDTSSSSTYVKVFDTGLTGKGTCSDVTTSSGLGLAFSDSDTVATLQSTADMPTTLEGHKLKIYIKATNIAGKTADNGTTSNCAGQPFTITVYGAPSIPDNINMGTATVDTNYSYDFMTQGGVTTGSSVLNPTSSTCAITSNGSTVTDSNLTCSITTTYVAVSGLVNAKYASSTLGVVLNLVNTDGLSATNSGAAASLSVAANSGELPSVGGSSAVTSVNQGATYSGYTFTDVTPGTNRSYASVNSATGTYVKVADASGNDVTSLAHLNLSTNGSTLILQSNGSAVDSSLQGSYNVYVHVINDANVVASNCSDITCSALTGGTPYTLLVNSAPVLSSNINLGTGTIGTAYSYDFVAQGSLVLGSNNLDTSASTATMTIDGATVTAAELGLTPVISATDVILSGTPNPGYNNKTVKLTLNLQDTVGLTASNASAPAVLTVSANGSYIPVVNSVGNALSPTIEGSTYNYTYTTSPMLAGPTGSNETFTSATATVLDSGNGNADVSSGFTLTLNSANTAITGLSASAATVAGLKGPLNVTYNVTNIDGASLSSTTADTIATDAIDVNDTTMTAGNVGADYSYDFAASAGLVVGSTGLDTTNSSVVMSIDGTSVTAAELGLTPVVSSTNVIVSGTPNSGYANKTVTFNLTLKTPDGLLTKTSTSTLAIGANIENAPTVSSGTSLSPTVEGNAYSYTYASPMLAGPADSGETFASTTLTVTDAGNSNATVDGFSLVINSENNQITGLTASAATVASVKGPLNVSYTVVNSDGQSATSTTPDTIATDAIDVEDATMTAATVSNVYNYDFGVVTGSTGLDATNSSVVMSIDGASVSSTALGLTPAITNTGVTVSGTPNVGYADKTVAFDLTLKTPDGQLTKTSTSTLVINANALNLPAVTGGTISDGSQFTTYSYAFPTTGSGAVVYAGDNNETFNAADTTFTVTDAAGNDQTSLFNLSYGTDASNNNVAQMTLTSGSNTLPSQGSWNVTLNVVNSDAQPATGNFTFTVGANSAYDPSVGTTGTTLSNAVVNGVNSQAYSYSYSNAPMIAGPSGAAFDTTQTKALVYYDAAKTQPVSGDFALAFSADNTAITGLTASASTIQSLTSGSTLYVYYQAVNTTNVDDVVTSTTADVIKTDFVSVNSTVTIPDTKQNVSMATYSFAESASLTVGSTGISGFASQGGVSTVTASMNGGAAVDPATLGLTVQAVQTSGSSVYNDVQVSGTPNTSGTLVLTLALATPDAQVSQSSSATSSIAANAVTGYLYCPSSATVSTNPRPSAPTSELYETSTGGNGIASITFSSGDKGSGDIQLQTASLNNGVLTCRYGFQGDDTSGIQYTAKASLPGAAAYSSDWSNGSCNIGSNHTAADADSHCQVTYTYTG